MTTPQDLRFRARDLERTATELEGIEKTIAFLVANPTLKPTIEVEFGGHLSDGEMAARHLRDLFKSQWNPDEVLAHFRKRRDEIKEDFK